jgi:tetratricopeptide (TPR) repeat protein
MCRDFLAAQGSMPRVLRIFGASGTGKSFLVRELMVQSSADKKDGIGVYLDVPPGELEASAILEKLDSLLSGPRKTSRDAPSFVGRKAARAWISAKRGRSAKRVSYLYGAFRELTAQIPLVGLFIKALLPAAAPVKAVTGDSGASLRFLMRKSKSQDVLLAIDNVQFLPFATRETLTAAFADAGSHLCLVLIERVYEQPRLDWLPDIPNAEAMDIDLENASLAEVTMLVKDALPEADDFGDIAATVFRRSGGNLKSVWFQLRLIASRREEQGALPTSYEDVILTLPALDQAVLRFIVFTIGGLTIASLVSLLHATDFRLRPDDVTGTITDLAALGLLVVNGDSSDRVRVEHELVAQVVSEMTPEDEKLELHTQAVSALSTVLGSGATPSEEAVLYDRLLGIVTDVELSQNPSLLSHVVQFIQLQGEHERYGYLSSICRDSVCWDVLDVLPETTVRCLLDSIQKSALFSFGLVATTRLRQSDGLHAAVASLYEAKYLVQLFRYEEAASALARVPESKEKRAVSFNIMLNLAQDAEAARIAVEVHGEVMDSSGTEQDYLILRNSGHLFEPTDARTLVEASVVGFESLGRRFGVASALNNLGVIDLSEGAIATARDRFNAARRQFIELDSTEVYQPLVNLSALALLDGDTQTATQLLSAARDAAPRSLLQDNAMFKLNAIALEVYESTGFRSSLADDMRKVLDEARQTQDIRFVDVAAWFADSLQGALLGSDIPAGPASRRIAEIRSSGRVGIEVFIPKKIGATRIDIPFVLSPQWRY